MCGLMCDGHRSDDGGGRSWRRCRVGSHGARLVHGKALGRRPQRWGDSRLAPVKCKAEKKREKKAKRAKERQKKGKDKAKKGKERQADRWRWIEEGYMFMFMYLSNLWRWILGCGIYVYELV